MIKSHKGSTCRGVEGSTYKQRYMKLEFTKIRAASCTYTSKNEPRHTIYVSEGGRQVHVYQGSHHNWNEDGQLENNRHTCKPVG